MLTGEAGAAVSLHAADLADALRSGPVVFETLTAVALMAARNAIAFHTWSEAGCELPAGATRATLVNDPPLALAAGDVLILATHPVRLTAVDELTDAVAGVDVVEIAWSPADAPPAALALDGALAHGNVALADHGLTLTGVPLGVAPDDVRPWRPAVPVPALTRAVPFALTDARSETVLDPGSAVAALRLSDGEDTWEALPELLGATGDTKAFVVELERDGSSWLRFGDDTNGARPSPGTLLTFDRVRSGVGAAGNVGPGTLSRVVSALAGITRVDNPLAAAGGADAEDIESIRRAAPAAFRVQQRAVTEADWVDVTERRPDVQRAAAVIRWTGSWYAVAVMIDRLGGLPVTSDPGFMADISAYLDRFRVAGYDLTVRDPIWVPIDLAVTVCVAPEHFRADVETGVRHALGRLFDPDNLTFGQPVFVSSIVTAAAAVDGVSKVLVTTFHEFGKADAGELADGVLAVGALEVARLDDDASFPERGRLALTVEGGR